jgi:hypothetical protein
MNQQPACRVCGATNVYWRQSAKGNWYLATTDNVSTTYGGNYAIPRAHSLTCAGAPTTREDIRAEYAARLAKLEWQKSLDATDDDDEQEMARLRADLEQLN